MGLVVLALCGVVNAAPVVVVSGAVPFSEDQATAALSVRVPDGAVVEIRETSGGVIVSIGGETRVVELNVTGEAAARLVALAASDLALSDLATPPVSAPGMTTVRRDPTTVALAGGIAVWDGALGGVTLRVTMPRDGWLLGVDVGGVTMVDGSFDLTGAVVRVGIGRRTGMVDLRVGATAVPISVSDGAGDRTILVGGTAGAYLRVPVAGVHVVLAAGVDGFATRTEYTMGGMTMATPWIAPWLEAGVELVP